jgi:endogenous inhibitor of DNA gyrase (YacG/DUF329 family)
MTAEPADKASGGRGKCPICGRTGQERYRPFCSRRCADVDLSRWLSGAYSIPEEGSDPADLPEGEDGESGQK